MGDPVTKFTNREVRALRALVGDRGSGTEGPIEGSTGSFSGAVTAAGFVGPLTGNASTATLAAAATTSVDGAAAKAVTDAATTAATASTVVKRDSLGFMLDRGDLEASILPNRRRLAAALGYTALDGYYDCQDASGALRSGCLAYAHALAVTASPTFGRPVDGGGGRALKGIWYDTDGDCFGYQQNVHDFGTSSVHLAVAFERTSDTGAIQALAGRYATDRYCTMAISAADVLTFYFNDGTHSTFPTVSATPIAVGGIYLAQLHLRRDTGHAYGRLSKLGTGLVSAESDTDLSAYTTFSGGTTPGFSTGYGPGWGTGNTILGIALRIGTEVEVSGRMAALAALCGFE